MKVYWKRNYKTHHRTVKECQILSVLGDYLFLGLNQRPPSTSEMMMKMMATHVNVVLSVERPMAKKAMPRIKKILDVLRLSNFIE